MRQRIILVAIALLFFPARSGADFCDYACSMDLQWECYFGEVVKRPDFDTPRFDVRVDGSPGSAVADMQWAHSFWRSACQGNTSALPQCSVVWDSGVSVNPDPYDGNNTVAWIYSQQLWSSLYSDQPYYETAGGFTTTNYYEDSCEIADTDTRFNGWRYLWGEGGLPNTADIRTHMLHEGGHQLGLTNTYDLFCADCQMYGFVGLGGADDWDILYGDRVAYCGLYHSTGVGDLYLFTATPSDGRVLLEWSVVPASGPHEFRLYASEDGAPFVLIHEEESGLYEENFSWWDEGVRNGREYHYAIWCDDGFAQGAGPCVPSGGGALAQYAGLSCAEEEGGIRITWTTSYENSVLDGFDVYGALGWEPLWGWDQSRYVTGDLLKLNESLISAVHAPHQYSFVDNAALHGRKYSYLIRARDGSDEERAGPAWNVCWRPYAAGSQLAFASGQPSCPIICPAGDISYQGRAPIKLEVSLQDSCGFAVEEYEDVRVLVEPGGPGNFELCCVEEQPAVLGPTLMLPSGPTNGEGKTWVDIWWGGGCDTQVEMTAYLPDRRQLTGEPYSPVRSPDLNADCQVDAQDFILFAQYYGTTAWQADFDSDGVVGPLDLEVVSSHFGHDCGNSETEPIPEELLPALTTGVDQQLPSFALRSNAPNPFSPMTEISYSVPTGGSHVSVSVFNLIGRLTRTLVDEDVSAGMHTVVWDGTDDRGRRVPSGVYFYRIDAPGFTERRAMVLLK